VPGKLPLPGVSHDHFSAIKHEGAVLYFLISRCTTHLLADFSEIACFHFVLLSMFYRLLPLFFKWRFAPG
jgi:hypothetical protein